VDELDTAGVIGDEFGLIDSFDETDRLVEDIGEAVCFSCV
jgi:hypothetical protein